MLVEISGLSKTYRSPDGGDAVPVLRDVSLSVEAGESLAIVGPSGSGKSTLLNILGALDRADTGTVRVGGHDLAALGGTALAAYRNREVAMIFQLHHLLPQCSVLENVLIPTLATPHDRAQLAALRQLAEFLLETVGLAHRLTHRPGQLSGGERQRVAVARALIHEPKLLLADEPTGALDKANAERLVELLAGLNRMRGVTLIMVTHAPDLARRMGRVLAIEDGRLGGV